MANDVSIRIIIEGSNEFKTVTVNAKELGSAIDEVTGSAQRLDKTIVESAAWSQILDGVNGVIQQLNSAMLDLTSAYSAQAQAETQIATMLGKVMNGQTEALSRYGYKFDEAQKYILQFGDENERAAILCQVVGESVGGMNKALAETDAGRFQQLTNAIGDAKEKLGQVAMVAQPLVSKLAAVGNTAAGIV